jgi:transposase-like protein
MIWIAAFRRITLGRAAMSINDKAGLIEKLSQLPIRNGKRVYSDELKREVLEYAGPLIAAGTAQTELARELGIVPCTLQRWHQGSRRAGGTSMESLPARASFVRLQPEAAVRNDGTGGIEVMIGVGRAVRVPIGFDGETLVRVVTLLEGLPT